MDRSVIVAAACAALVLYFVRLVYRRSNQISIADIPGPNPESFLLGNLRQIFQGQAGEYDFQWQEIYGGVYRIKTPFGEDRLIISDPKTLQYIFQTSGYDIIKQPSRRELSRLLTGRGLVWAEGDAHRRQRKVMTPGFGPMEVKSFLPLFSTCADQLATKWAEILIGTTNHSAVFNIPAWMSRATMDTIGLAAFDYKFRMLDDGYNELARTYNNILQEIHGRPSTDHGQAKHFVRAREFTKVANETAEKLVNDKAEALLQGKGSRDIMSLVVKANASEDEKTRLSKEEMSSQLRTVILAGYETTANSLSWTLFELAKNTDIQSRLRAEIRRFGGALNAQGNADISVNNFDKMHLTLAVIKESLRLHSVVHEIYRQTSKNDVFPLSEPVTTISGKVMHEIPVPQGLRFGVSIAAYNRNKQVWGPNAHSFDPDRWLNDTNGARNKGFPPVGVYGNLMTFGGGVRSCIGWRFAVAEMQAFLVELVGRFEISLTEEAMCIRRDVALVMIPTVEGQVEKGVQLPLRVTFAKSE